MMKIFDKWRKQKEQQFMINVSDKIKDRFKTGKKITPEEWKSLKMNSYERRLLFPLQSDELLLEQIEYYMNQEGVRELGQLDVSNNYLDELLRGQLPELIRRFNYLFAGGK